MMHTVTTQQQRTTRELSLGSLFNQLGDFKFRSLFKSLTVDRKGLGRRLEVVEAILFAEPTAWKALRSGQRNLLLAVLRYEARRVEGSWVGPEGRPGKLEFDTPGDRQRYRTQLGFAISQALVNQHA